MPTRDLLFDLNRGRNDPARVHSLQQRAVADDAEACFALGLLLAEGRGVDADIPAACRWLQRAHELGDQDAQTLLFAIQAQHFDATGSTA
jgi:TPR repeat protein